MSNFIDYPDFLFTSLRLQVMFMRFELLDTEKERPGLAPPDMLSIFLDLCALDGRIVAAQRARGYSDAPTLQEIRRVALERKDKP